MSFRFEQQALDESSAYFKRVRMNDEQKPIVEGIAQILQKTTGIEMLAVKGFILRTFKEWQMDNQKDVTYMASAEPEERIQIAGDLFIRFENKLKRILQSEEQQDLLHQAMLKALEFYTTNYANR